MTSGVAIEQVSFSYGDNLIIDNVSLDIAKGEFFAFLGPSGSGKTTLLRMIAGFGTPSSGRILIDGKDVTSLPPWSRNVGMVFQSYALWPHMTVSKNVAFGLERRRLPKAEIKRKVADALKLVGLAEFADRRPAQLSGGQQQRVALARTLVIEPSVLLLDEPLSNLDANLREEMRFEIRRLHDEFKITTVYVTHDQAEAMVTSDRIAVMNKGRVEQIDAPYALYGRPKTRFVAGFIGRTNFVEGKSDGDAVHFGGFSVPRHALQTEGSLPQDVLVSIRPQSIHLLKQDPGGGGDRCCVQGSVLRRAYLGEYWDYHVTLPGAAQFLRVTARPQEVFEVNEPVWIEIDTAQLTVIS